MAKVRPATGKKKATIAPTRGLVPCAIVILTGMILMALLLYYALKSGVSTTP